MVAIYLGARKPNRNGLQRLALYVGVGLALIGIGRGALVNTFSLKSAAESAIPTRERYATFFREHSFDPKANFLILSSPFVSDVQSVFQYFLGDFTIRVAHEPFSTLAKKGAWGCRGDYRIQDVPSRIVPIPDGFRLRSLDPEHCAWWFHPSDHPIWWEAEYRAYRWRRERYREGIWYKCSIGRFRINEMLEDKYVVDISFVIDRKCVDDDTVVVAWDTTRGAYAVLDAVHLRARVREVDQSESDGVQ